MENKLIKIDKMSYPILLRELVCQLKDPHIYSGNYSPSVNQLDFKLFPSCIKEKYSLSQLNTNSKVNINYITTKVDNNERAINPILFKILSNTKYFIDDKNNEYLEFITEKEKMIFEIMKSFKSVNADFFDVGNRNLKKALKTYESTAQFDKIPFNKDFSDELGPRSLILITPEKDVIYSNRIFISFEDFFYFNTDIDSVKLKKIENVKNDIFIKLKENKVYEYSLKMNDSVFKELNKELNKDIQKYYSKFSFCIECIPK